MSRNERTDSPRNGPTGGPALLGFCLGLGLATSTGDAARDGTCDQ
jgi:hypothetical protein